MQTGEVTIYGLTDPRTGDVRYVGKGADPVGRRRNHIWRAKAGYQHHKDRWIAGLLALGLEPGLVTLDVVPAGARDDRRQPAPADPRRAR